MQGTTFWLPSVLILQSPTQSGAHHSQVDPGSGQLGEGGILILILHFLQLLPGGGKEMW